MRRNHQCEKNDEALSSMRVGSGSLAWSDLKKTTKRGMTKVAKTTTTKTDMTATTPG